MIFAGRGPRGGEEGCGMPADLEIIGHIKLHINFIAPLGGAWLVKN